ncbi:MAG: leucine-rich repeat protein [Paraprevotella sp.]|nr:leucine-rich repeat protein [Paraprevotella sp.]
MLVLIMLANLLIGQANIAYADVQSGTYNYAAWTFDTETGCLKVTPTNGITEVPEYFVGHVLHEGTTNYEDILIKKIVICDGFTSIGDHAFYKCFSLSEIVFPESGLKTIEAYSFFQAGQQNGSLTHVNLPEGLIEIGESAFQETALKSIKLPESLTTLGKRAFNACDNITSVFIPKNVNSIGAAAWGNTNSKLTEYVVDAENSTYTSLDGVLYTKDMKTLVSCPVSKPGVFTVPEGVETLAESSFTCSNTGVILPSSLKTIEDEAFSAYNYKRGVVIPEGVTTIGANTFEYAFIDFLSLPSTLSAETYNSLSLQTNNIKTLVINSTTPPAVGNKFFWGSFTGTPITSFKHVLVPNASVDDYKSAEKWSSYADYIAPKSLNCGVEYKYLDNNTVLNLSSTTEKTLTIDASETNLWTTITSGIAAVEIEGNISNIDQTAFKNNKTITSLTILDGVKCIGEYAFSGCNNLKTVLLSSQSLEELGANCFEYCGMGTITLPSGLKTINDDSFFNCSSLGEIKAYCTALETVSGKAFTGTKNGCYAASYANAGPNQLKGKLSKYYVLGGEIGNIRWECPLDMTSMTITPVKTTEGVIPNEFIKIIDGFDTDNMKSSSVKTLYIKDGIKAIGDYAFMNSNLSLCDMSANTVLETIGEGAFYECTQLGLDGKSSVKTILPNSVKTIANKAFMSCTNFNNGGQALPTSLVSIGQEAFKSCGFSGILNLPEGLTTIDDNAFSYMDNITEVVIPASLATLGNNVFVTSISNGGYYPKFTVAEGNTNFAVEENLDKDDATDDCMLYGLRDGKNVRVIGYHYPKAKTADKTIIFNKDVETVDDNALYSSPFSTVVFMENVKSIGDYIRPNNTVSEPKISIYSDEPPRIDKSQQGSTKIYFKVVDTSKYTSLDAWQSEFFEIMPLDIATLNDNDPYTGTGETKDKVIVKRNFANTKWQALYLPVSLDCSELVEDYDIAYINNVHQFDDNEDGVIDRTQLEAIRMKSGKTLPNTPYLIKAKTTGDKEITLLLATLSAAEEPTFNVMSWYNEYVFHTTFSGVSGTVMVANGYYALSEGSLVKATNTANSLRPNRWYLEIKGRTGGGASAAPKSIDIVVDGEDDNPTTGIFEVETGNNVDKCADNKVYDLNGRMVKTGNSLKDLPKGIYIMNGKKYVK